MDNKPESLTLSGVPRGAVAHLLAGVAAKGLGALGGRGRAAYVAAGDRQMEALRQALPFFLPDARVLAFPAWDCLPYDRASPHSAITAERIQTLAALAEESNGRPAILLTTVNALLQRTLPRETVAGAAFALAAGNSVDREALVRFLLERGYRRAEKVMEPGEFALRGSIVDVFPPGEEEGLRLDFFGDALESLRGFDPMTQRGGERRKACTLHPAGEVMLDPASTERFRVRYREAFGAVSRDDPLYESVSNRQPFPGMEHWLPLFHEQLDTLFDYLRDTPLLLDHEARTAAAERLEAIRDYYDARKASKGDARLSGMVYHPLPPEQLYLMGEEWERLLAAQPHAFVSPFASVEGGQVLAIGWRQAHPFSAERATPGMNVFDALREHAVTQRNAGRATVLACVTNGTRERMATLLADRHIPTRHVTSWPEAEALEDAIGLAVLPLEQGFETERVALITEQDLLGERMIRTGKAKKRKADAFLSEAANFTEGELVVHREHGIGRFEGLVTLTVLGAKHDCLKLVYADDDKLFLPVENIDLLSRYGSEVEGVRLDKLGGASWQARRARLKERIQLAAEELLKTAAERQLRPGIPLSSPPELYDAFCARFPYPETDDQAKAIDDVLADLASGKPMDRLICGDVGFGKTEVALRAAFVAATGLTDESAEEAERPFRGGAQSAGGPPPATKGTQVALIAPTTLLARQHYRNFAERFAGLGLAVRQLSRMVPAKEQKETHAMLADGRAQIVIGTHALLSKHIQFHHLGLLIVDEEQHFGVAQKEKLKALKSDVHVMSLSATPIPRTLQMALSGVRDLSLITTPPVDRLAIRSFVMPFDSVVLREAILRERHRGGKVFCVTPRIKDIAELKPRLAELAPDISIAVAHGQMAPGELDRVMNAFYDGKYDLLLSTAIIESGLDVPTANTIILHRADMFGLAQLYQLRGRVGRGKQRAYAYFLLPPYKEMTKNAQKRLEVMQTLDTLGAGFTLASHDMDIRGFGNLLGEEQSGHVREVGIELYQQMLEEAVAATKAAIPSPAGGGAEWSPQINLGISVLIPESYVADLSLRLGLYRRLAQLSSSEEVDGFAAELIDRFGPLPEEAQHLLAVMQIKQLCRQAGIEKVDVGDKGALLTFRGDRPANPERLLEFITKHAEMVKLRPDQKLVVRHQWKNNREKFDGIRRTLADMAKLAA